MFISQLSSTIWYHGVYYSTCQIDGEKWSKEILWMYFSLGEKGCKMEKGTTAESQRNIPFAHIIFWLLHQPVWLRREAFCYRIPTGSFRASNQCQLLSILLLRSAEFVTVDYHFLHQLCWALLKPFKILTEIQSKGSIFYVFLQCQ